MICPFCGTDNDMHSPLSDASEPYSGAASLCAYCCRFGIFETVGNDGKLAIRKPTDQEQHELDSDTDAQQALKLAQGMMFLAALRGTP